MAKHNELGRLGEEMAVEYLRKKGYGVLERNWKLGDLEVDIIARMEETKRTSWIKGTKEMKETLVLVEVKTRSSDWMQRPEEAVDRRRRDRLCRAANAYVKGKRWNGNVRIDIIAIVLNESRKEINHIEDAVHPRGRFY